MWGGVSIFLPSSLIKKALTMRTEKVGKNVLKEIKPQIAKEIITVATSKEIKSLVLNELHSCLLWVSAMELPWKYKARSRGKQEIGRDEYRFK